MSKEKEGLKERMNDAGFEKLAPVKKETVADFNGTGTSEVKRMISHGRKHF